MKEFGCQNMAGRLRRVIVRRPDRLFANADPAEWHYNGRPDLQRALAEHDDFVSLLQAGEVEVIYHEGPENRSADAIFTHDSALVTDGGSIILSMGKLLRRGEEEAMAQVLREAGIPEFGRLEGAARAEGGDLLWLDKETLAIGVGFRTNSEGAEQLTNLLRRIGVSTLTFDLPFYQGEAACLHLMSLISLVDDDLAVVYPPLLPVRLFQALGKRGIRTVDVPREEFLTRQATNVLAVAPRDVVMLEGNPVTESRLRDAGCRLATYRGDEITLKAEGGATCLTRPVLRDG